jgi:hypothetical protein
MAATSAITDADANPPCSGCRCCGLAWHFTRCGREFNILADGLSGRDPELGQFA